MKRLFLAVGLCVTLSVEAAFFPQSFTTNSFSNGYGLMAPTNILVLPTAFSVIASDWNPVVISGAGTAGANGNYYMAISNLVSGVPYAVWTNSSGGNFRLFYNNTNIVPSSLSSNIWTLQDSSDSNFYYDMIGTHPFGSWFVSEFGGTQGSLPVPDVGPRLPSIISAVRSLGASGGTLTLTPGLYNMQYFQLKTTNLNIMAEGATLVFDIATAGWIPSGNVNIYGGQILNTNTLQGNGGGNAFDASLVTTNFLSINTVFFGGSDTAIGTLKENTHFTFIGGEFGTWWDTSSFSASGKTNVYLSFLGTSFHAYFNRPALLAIGNNAFQAHGGESFGPTQYLSGCTAIIENGFTNTGSAAFFSTGTGSALHLSGCRGVVGTNAAKILLANGGGAIYVDGFPYNYETTSGNIVYSGSSVIRTNFIGGQLYTNTYGRTINVSCTASNVYSATAGDSILRLWCYVQGAADIAGFTNFYGESHQAITATTNFGNLNGQIPNGYVWTFTNQVSGSGNAASIIGGQLWIP